MSSEIIILYMQGIELLLEYFPDLSQEQQLAFSKLAEVYAEWNEKINVISRKDINNLYEHHVLHSLSIAKFISFRNGTKVMDLGTGGGFPGVPLAILFPECRFHLVDSIGKKLKVIEAAREATGLKNIFTFHSRAEDMEYQYDFVVSRAVAPLRELMRWSTTKFLPKHLNEKRNGLICLKGGDLTAEKEGIKIVQTTPLSTYFSEEFFEDKSLVYVPK
jgi:16S rRNA (guanine527-N7)-methyltransferase